MRNKTRKGEKSRAEKEREAESARNALHAPLISVARPIQIICIFNAIDRFNRSFRARRFFRRARNRAYPHSRGDIPPASARTGAAQPRTGDDRRRESLARLSPPRDARTQMNYYNKFSSECVGVSTDDGVPVKCSLSLPPRRFLTATFAHRNLAQTSRLRKFTFRTRRSRR